MSQISQKSKLNILEKMLIEEEYSFFFNFLDGGKA